MKAARYGLLSLVYVCASGVHAENSEADTYTRDFKEPAEITASYVKEEVPHQPPMSWHYLVSPEPAGLARPRWQIDLASLDNSHDLLGFWPSIYWLNSNNFDASIASLGYTWRNLKLEGALIRGRNADQSRGNDVSRIDFAAKRVRRLSYRLNSNLSLQLSRGVINIPEQLRYDTKLRRTIASVSYQQLVLGNSWNTTLAAGRGKGQFGTTGMLYWLESTMRVGEEHTVFGRLERGNNDQLFRADSTPSLYPYPVNKLSVGYLYELKNTNTIRFGIGGLVSKQTVLDELMANNAAKNTSYMVFFRLKMPLTDY